MREQGLHIIASVLAWIGKLFMGKPKEPKPDVFDIVPTTAHFDWLKDYGPYWEPATTAFWLAPDTEDEVRAWYFKYRPNEARIIYGASQNNPYMNTYISPYGHLLSGYQSGLINQNYRRQGYLGNILGNLL